VPVVFRKAEKGDLDCLVELMGQLGYSVDAKTLSDNLNHYQGTVLVAVDGERVIGCLAYHVLQLFHSADRHMRIVSLVIDQTHRGQGVGKRLLARAEKLAKKLGCIAVELTSGRHRAKTGAHTFYCMQGYQRNGKTAYFRKIIGPEPRKKELPQPLWLQEP
jgi:GNAT superfamily N-acetyltransferase